MDKSSSATYNVFYTVTVWKGSLVLRGCKEISGRGRRRSYDEKGNHGVGDLRFINILQFFSIYFVFSITSYYIIFSILFLPTTFTHTHTHDSRPLPITYDPRHLATLAQVKFSAKPNQVARARRASKCNLWSLKNLYECWFIPNCTKKIWMHAKIWFSPLYLSLLVTAPCCSLQMTTSIKIGQHFDRWILIDKNAATRNLFTKNWCLLSFYVFNFSCFSTAATERNTTAIKIPLFCFIYLGFGWGKRHNKRGFHRRLFL